MSDVVKVEQGSPYLVILNGNVVRSDAYGDMQVDAEYTLDALVVWNLISFTYVFELFKGDHLRIIFLSTGQNVDIFVKEHVPRHQKVYVSNVVPEV